MEIKVTKVLLEQKKAFGVTTLSLGVEIATIFILFLILGWIFSVIFVAIAHPILVALTKKDSLFVDITLQNLDNPKELYF